MKLVAKNFRIDPQSFGVGFLAGFILLSLTYVTMNNTDLVQLALTSFQPSSWTIAVPASPADERITKALSLEPGNATQNGSFSTPMDSSSKTSEISSLPNDGLPSSTAKPDQVKPTEGKIICDFSNRRTDVCNVYGDVRIIGKQMSSVMVVTSAQGSDSWQIRPYPRGKMPNVREVNIKTLRPYEEAPQCTVNHTVPGIIFSDTGLAGNYFHDFIEVLVPLFKTAHQFHGEVQLLVTDYRLHWINKYLLYLKTLSQYDIIDYDADGRVHCFKHVIVGLNFDGELLIDASKPPKGYSMVDFTKLTRRAYSLEREYPLRISEQSGLKPRLLIIDRSKSRKLVNIDEIVHRAEEVGFEVVVAEGDPDVAKFSHIVNSCDVMMGVHGSGLTNSVFLPTHAVLIQVVPFGKLEFLARTSFGEPAMGMKLKYLEYSISAEESTLINLYPRDDPVLKDPDSVHKQGWGKMAEAYLHQQNVKLDVRRFRPVLEKAFSLLQER